MEHIQDISTMAVSDRMNGIYLQSNPHVIPGLQRIIPGCRINIKMTPAAGKRKVSMSIAQARNELKGQSKSKGSARNNPPVMPSLSDPTPPASNFLSNEGNRAYPKTSVLLQ
jgi:hypothetical protein